MKLVKLCHSLEKYEVDIGEYFSKIVNNDYLFYNHLVLPVEFVVAQLRQRRANGNPVSNG
jgi:hypothetical protein